MSPDALKTLLRGFLSGESHPGRSLISHLEGVSDISLGIGRTHNVLNADEETLLSKIALTHDLGKERPEWQNYLNKGGPKTNHSTASSLFTFDTTGDVMAAELVRSHHGSFPDLNRAITDFWGRDDFSVDEAQDAMNKTLPKWKKLLKKDEWEDLIETILFEAPPCDEKTWLRGRTLFSLFITADRMNALGASHFELPSLPEFNPPVFHKTTSIDAWRAKVRNDCLKNAAENGEPGIYTLTLPTGTGKTFIGLEIASQWAERHGYTSITYVLPFISIVEQNSDIARKLFGRDLVQEDHSRSLIARSQEQNGPSSHKSSEDEEAASPLEKFEALFRYWRHPVAVTTMAHFWDALYGARANSTMNFHRLGKSVVILDEPQSISADHWPGLGSTLELLTSEWETAFILMTATQPHIASGKTKELAPKKHRKPDGNRRNYKILPGRHSLDDFPALLWAHIPLDEPSGLIVANTRREALEMYRMFCSMKEEEGDSAFSKAPVFFLSTWLTPAHRRRTLSEIRRLEAENLPRYLVSTQVVEAGVDLDFNWVARDFGPFDSVVQVGGRCNRHGREKPGTVLIGKFINEYGRAFSSMVYSSVLLNAMEGISAACPEFGENDIAPLIDKYYSLVTGATRGSGIWKKIKEGNWDQLPSLYEEPPSDTSSLIIESKGIRELVNRLAEEKWTLEKLEAKKILMNRLQQHTIEIPGKMLPGCRIMLSKRHFIEFEPLEKIGNSNMWLLSEEASDILYHPVTGFIPPESEGGDIDSAFA